MDFENNPRRQFEGKESDMENIKSQLASAKTADEMMVLVMKAKELEGDKKELIGNAQEEAGAEDLQKQENLGAEMAKDKENEILANELSLEAMAEEDEKKSEEARAEILRKLNGEVEAKTPVEVKVEEKMETSDRINDIKKLSPETIKKINPLKNDLIYEKYTIERNKGKIERCMRFIESNEKALIQLKDDLGRLVKKSTVHSESGGYGWELITKTEEYRSLSNQRKEYARELKSKGKKFDEIQNDETIRDLDKRMSMFDTSGIANVFRSTAEGKEVVELDFPNGALDVGTTNLGDALNKCTELYKESIKKLEGVNMASKNKIKDIEKQIESLEK